MGAFPDDHTPPTLPAGVIGDESEVASAQRPVQGANKPAFVRRPTWSDGAESAEALESERFVPRAVIGRGGSGMVIRAFDKGLLREVAIKVLDAELAEGTPEVDRFAEEARINGQLEHPNIVPVYELGVDQRGRRFLCMKFVQGITLEEALARSGSSRLDPVR